MDACDGKLDGNLDLKKATAKRGLHVQRQRKSRRSSGPSERVSDYERLLEVGPETATSGTVTAVEMYVALEEEFARGKKQDFTRYGGRMYYFLYWDLAWTVFSCHPHPSHLSMHLPSFSHARLTYD